jgi:prevent-host-death family protein
VDTLISAAELGKNLSDVLDRVRERGERFTVARDGEPVAALVPTNTPSITLRELASQMGDIPLPDDRFAEDIEAMREALAPEEPPAWPS